MKEIKTFASIVETFYIFSAFMREIYVYIFMCASLKELNMKVDNYCGNMKWFSNCEMELDNHNRWCELIFIYSHLNDLYRILSTRVKHKWRLSIKFQFLTTFFTFQIKKNFSNTNFVTVGVKSRFLSLPNKCTSPL